MRSLACGVLLLLFAVVLADDDVVYPSHVEIVFDNMLPVGLAYDDDLGFLLSSLTFGTIYRLDTNGVAVAAFGSGGLSHTTGLLVDSANNRLLVVNNNVFPVVGTSGTLVAFDLTTGVSNFKASLSGSLPLLAYGVALDSQRGNAYVTDAYSGRIFQVAKNGSVQVYVSSPIFKPPFDSRLGLTGIVCFSDDYLLASVTGSDQTSYLYKIPLEDDPYTFQQVEFVGGNLPGLSALKWDSQRGTLFAIASQSGQLFELVSNDEWVSASIASSQLIPFPNPTSLALGADNTPYVICQTVPSGPYDLVQMYPPDIDYDDIGNDGGKMNPISVAVLALTAVMLMLL